MSNVSVIGIGYVGLVSAVCLAELGHHVTCVDIDLEKINGLKNGKVPIFELNLPDLLEKNKESLVFTNDFMQATKNADAIFIAVNTPQDEDGSANMVYYYNAVQKIADIIDEYTVIVNKSTVPVGTAEHVKSLLDICLKERNVSIPFDVVSNPEFLREGTSIQDFMHPDRIIIGTTSEKAREVMNAIYKPLSNQGHEVFFCDNRTAELVKYASNAFLAVKISFINELSALCDSIGADISEVAYGMGLDKRIGKSYLQAGPGYGGSCFPKDTRALCCIGDAYDTDLSIVKTAIESNLKHKNRMCEKISNAFGGELSGKTIALLGLAFKKNTDDMRYSPALVIVDYLSKNKVKIRAHDPAAMKNAKENYFIGNNIEYTNDLYDASKGADAVVIVTEWDDFRKIDLNKLKDIMAGNIIIDLRNIYQRKTIENFGFKYFCVGR